MIEIEFGIIDKIDKNTDYEEYDPSTYNCISIDDDLYIDDWWDRLMLMKTFYHNLNRPAYGLARYGITIIPPESLPAFQDIVITDKRIYTDDSLVALANKIQKAIKENKYMIHFGV